MFTLYMTMFNHGPPSEILEANRQIVLKPKDDVDLSLNGEELDEDEEVSESVESAKRWQKFVDDNKYVAIGDVYNSCGEFWHDGNTAVLKLFWINISLFWNGLIYIIFLDDKDRITLGKAILLPDKETGGLKVRTFINITLGKNVSFYCTSIMLL